MNFNLQVVLIEPEIPQNTGNIGRLCLATGSTLHLVHPLGFEITHSRLRRAGLDYWEHLNLVEHENLDAFLKTLTPDSTVALFSKKAGHLYTEKIYKPNHYLIFGKETAGLPESLLNRFPTDTVRIPLFDARVRSLNLAHAVGIGVYEAIRQLDVK